MSSLEILQQRFYQALTDTEAANLSEILPNQRMTSDERVALYQEAYRLRLLEALADTFPAVHTLAGDAMFEKIGTRYIESHPSSHFSIRYFGHLLAQFLAGEKEYQRFPVLSEMAMFEWQLRDVFDALDAKPLNKSNMNFSLEEWPGLVFQLIPAYRRLALRWNVPALWKAIEQEADPIDAVDTGTLTHWIIWRPHLETKFRSLEFAETQALQLLEEKITFEALCLAMADLGHADPAALVAGIISRFLEDEIIHRVISK